MVNPLESMSPGSQLPLARFRESGRTSRTIHPSVIDIHLDVSGSGTLFGEVNNAILVVFLFPYQNTRFNLTAGK
ncbi:hypothetical protein [Sedimentitalea sp.]|uniref:hypothetical protein n=1 Tax=Sedimentitalea sp. TaxID=2048915 RepID=UPI00329A523C